MGGRIELRREYRFSVKTRKIIEVRIENPSRRGNTYRPGRWPTVRVAHVTQNGQGGAQPRMLTGIARVSIPRNQDCLDLSKVNRLKDTQQRNTERRLAREIRGQIRRGRSRK